MLLALDWYYKVAIFQLELETCTSALDLRYKVAIFQLVLDF